MARKIHGDTHSLVMKLVETIEKWLFRGNDAIVRSGGLQALKV